MYQPCIRFVRQELYLRPDSDLLDSIKTLGFFLGNGARFDVLDIDGDSLTSSCITWLKLNFYDISILKCIILGTRASHYQTMYSVNRRRDTYYFRGKMESCKGWKCISRVSQATWKNSKEDFYRECLRLLGASGLSSLRKIMIFQFPSSFEIYNPLFLCVADRLEELRVYLNKDWTRMGDKKPKAWSKAKIKRVEQLVVKHLV